MKRLLMGALLLGSLAQASGLTLTGYAGFSSPRSDWHTEGAWSVHALYRIDQMVAAGVGVGYASLPGTDVAEATARIQARLPFGKQLLPFVEAEAGAGLRPVLENSRFFWRTGGGLDLKLGDRSSLLAGGGLMTYGRAYGRMGLLLEL